MAIPNPPTGLACLPSIAGDKIRVRWTPDPSAFADPPAGHTLERSDDGAPFAVLASGLDTAASSYMDDTVAPGGHYGYRIKSVNTDGDSDYNAYAPLAARVDTPPVIFDAALADAIDRHNLLFSP